MNLLIQLPPEVKRKEMIEAWVSAFVNQENGFDNFQQIVHELIDEGYSSHGINCFFLHESTQKFIKNKIVLKRNTPFIEAALFHPISLN
ncbi:hypothetical protein EP331_07185 [bacterium]|nr:MAG: hypothetical protein EP331_07185 [bacterium]